MGSRCVSCSVSLATNAIAWELAGPMGACPEVRCCPEGLVASTVGVEPIASVFAVRPADGRSRGVSVSVHRTRAPDPEHASPVRPLLTEAFSELRTFHGKVVPLYFIAGYTRALFD
jgi:hypothetical protein